MQTADWPFYVTKFGINVNEQGRLRDQMQAGFIANVFISIMSLGLFRLNTETESRDISSKQFVIEYLTQEKINPKVNDIAFFAFQKTRRL